MNKSQNNFIEGIGNTPLIKLRVASEITGCSIFGKAEYLNPGGSVKAVSYTHLTLPTTPYV